MSIAAVAVTISGFQALLAVIVFRRTIGAQREMNQRSLDLAMPPYTATKLAGEGQSFVRISNIGSRPLLCKSGMSSSWLEPGQSSTEPQGTSLRLAVGDPILPVHHTFIIDESTPTGPISRRHTTYSQLT